jgi:hypothetical protein
MSRHPTVPIRKSLAARLHPRLEGMSCGAK